MKNHLKRIAAPKSWKIDRKYSKWILRPNQGSHCLDMGLALGIILRDELHMAPTMDAVKKALKSNEVLVDGQRRKDHRHMVGLFDVITIPLVKKQYRLVFDSQGRLTIREIKASESSLKPCKIVGKSVLSGNKIQFHLHDGRNITSAEKAKVGDTFVISLPEGKVKEVLPLQGGVFVFLTRGKHRGDTGVLKEIKAAQAVYSRNNEDVETLKEYVFVLGTKKPVIELSDAQIESKELP